MPPKVIRIYKGTRENTNIVGFNAAVIDSGDDEAAIDFFDRQGYLAAAVLKEPEGGASHKYLQVEPPISYEMLQEFGAFCLRLNDLSEDTLKLIDNRFDHPEEIEHSGAVIASS